MNQKIHIVIQLAGVAFLLNGAKKMPVENTYLHSKGNCIKWLRRKSPSFKTKSFTFTKTPFLFYLSSEPDPSVFLFVSFYLTCVIVLLKYNTHKEQSIKAQLSNYHNVNSHVTNPFFYTKVPITLIF